MMFTKRHFKQWSTIVVLHGWLLLACLPAQGQPFRSPHLNAQYHRAETAWKSGGSLLEAKARVDRVLEKLPNDAEARKLRAQVLLALDQPKPALEDARQAVSLRPEDGEARLIMAEAARLNGQPQLACRTLDEAAERLLNDAGLHVRLSWNAQQLDQLSKAEAYARTALALDPNLPAAFYQLARVFVVQRRTNDAVAILQRGFDKNLLSAAAVANDTVLAPLAQHETLQGRMH